MNFPNTVFSPAKHFLGPQRPTFGSGLGFRTLMVTQNGIKHFKDSDYAFYFIGINDNVMDFIGMYLKSNGLS